MTTYRKPLVNFADTVADSATDSNEEVLGSVELTANFETIGGVSPTVSTPNAADSAGEGRGQAGPLLHNAGPDDVPIGVGGDEDDNVLFIRGNDGPYEVDGGDGEDTIDFSVFNVGVRLSLFEGTFLRTGEPKDMTSQITAVEHAIGSAHRDVLLGDTGRNEFFGGAGDDLILGYAGSDLLMGQDGNDNIRGGRGRDTIVGGDGDDLLNGGTEDDLLRGSDGNDYLWGVTGEDVLEGGLGNDKLRGGSEADQMFGGDGIDDLRGGTGDDFMSGDDGNDWMSGGTGDDTMVGGAGNDALIGGTGADVFVFAQGSEIDRVKDWESGVDRIDLSDWGLESVEALMGLVSQTNEMVQIKFSDDDILVLYTLETLDTNDVIL